MRIQPDVRSRARSRAESRARACAAAIVLLLTAGTLPAAAPETPLGLLEVSAKKKGWNGIDLGMSVVQVERRLGFTIPLTEKPNAACGPFQIVAAYGELGLTLGFPSQKPGAKLETLYVHFDGPQVLAKRDDLVAELKRLAPQATYFAPAKLPDLSESDAADPTYALPGGDGLAIRLDPGRGLLLAPKSCIG